MEFLSGMNRSDARAALRVALIDAAARLIATEGTHALTLRRVADEVGTSTMAIYTHFGGMPELRRAVRREGFARLAARNERVGESDDPVADIIKLGIDYYEQGISEPHLYRVMFMEPLDEEDAATGWDTFETLVGAMQRSIDAGRFAPADAVELAVQFWAVGHGVITLQIAKLLQPNQARKSLATAVRNLFIAYGDKPEATAQSFARASPPERHAKRSVA